MHNNPALCAKHCPNVYVPKPKLKLGVNRVLIHIYQWTLRMQCLRVVNWTHFPTLCVGDTFKIKFTKVCKPWSFGLTWPDKMLSVYGILQGQASPTTGKLHMLGGANDSNPIRFESPRIEEGSGAFSFKPLNLASSHYAAEEKTVSRVNWKIIHTLRTCSSCYYWFW